MNLFTRNHLPMSLGEDIRCLVKCTSDASGLGAGAVVEIDGEKEMLQFSFTDYERGFDINWQELAAVTALCEKWASRFAGKRVVLQVDNTSTMYAIKKGTSSSAAIIVTNADIRKR